MQVHWLQAAGARDAGATTAAGARDARDVLRRRRPWVSRVEMERRRPSSEGAPVAGRRVSLQSVQTCRGTPRDVRAWGESSAAVRRGESSGGYGGGGRREAVAGRWMGGRKAGPAPPPPSLGIPREEGAEARAVGSVLSRSGTWVLLANTEPISRGGARDCA